MNLFIQASYHLFSPLNSRFSGESLGIIWNLGTGFLVRQDRTYMFDAEFSPTNLREEVFWNKSVTMRIGYRYQKPEGGFFFRAGYTPMLNFEGSEFAEKPIRFFPFNVGISLGKSF